MEYLAYIDAGTGSMFIQAVFGVVLAGVVVLRTYVRRVFAKVKVAIRPKSVNEEA